MALEPGGIRQQQGEPPILQLSLKEAEESLVVAEPFEDYFSSYPKDMTDWERLVLTCVTEELDLASVAQLDKKGRV